MQEYNHRKKMFTEATGIPRERIKKIEDITDETMLTLVKNKTVKQSKAVEIIESSMKKLKNNREKSIYIYFIIQGFQHGQQEFMKKLAQGMIGAEVCLCEECAEEEANKEKDNIDSMYGNTYV